MNQKGQSFSVFELMIAAVVAFAILIILLNMLNIDFFGCSNTGGMSFRDTISNSVKAAMPSGQTTTSNFCVTKDSITESTDLALKASVEPSSIFFLKGELKDNQSVIVDSSTSGSSYFKYTASTNVKLKAMTMCKQTAAALDQSLTILGDKYDLSASTAEAYCKESQPCCAIILLRQS
jgi:hypothetical protein